MYRKIPPRLFTSPLHRSQFIHGHRRHFTSFIPPKVFLSAGKVASRVAIGAGGTAAATVTYYQNKLSGWADQMTDEAASLYGWYQSLPNLSDFELPSYDFTRKQADIDLNDHQPQNDITSAPVALLSQDGDDDDDEEEEEEEIVKPKLTGDNHFMALTRRLIEVKNILRPVGFADTLQLPALVVIGSQSSGKSSLLESIVGHEFLPKGLNMVTRRPIEVTLIHTPDSSEEYADLPSHGIHHIKDFTKVQSILADLNMAVSDEQCVSDEPIDLRIYSPNVPDLTLIDLPGYIAVNTRNQPTELKEKIVALCRRYIAEPNIILAVSAADVDLANSEALNEARKADPLSVRTVGILTKMDLIPPQRGVALLQTEEFSLHLGFWGVICKERADTKSAPPSTRTKYKRVQSSEESYFREHADVYSRVGSHLGIRTLRRSLMDVLETRMTRSLQGIISTVQHELEEARYQFKVQFNDRIITPEAYVTDVMEGMKSGFRNVSQQYDRKAVRETIQGLLDMRVAQLCNSLYWSSSRTNELAHSKEWSDEDWAHWSAVLDRAHSLFTRSGLGRQTTQTVIDNITVSLENQLNAEPFIHHSDASRRTMLLASELLKSKMYQTIEQVENSIKPFKFEFDFSAEEWNDGVKRAIKMLQSQVAESKTQFDEIKKSMGRRNLRTALQYIDETERKKDTIVTADSKSVDGKVPTMPLPPTLMAKGYEAWQLQRKMQVLEKRLNMITPGWIWSSECSAYNAFKASVTKVTKSQNNPNNRNKSQISGQSLAVPHTCRPICPEPYLMVVSAKLAQSAMMFLWIELLHEFYYLYPRELDHQIYYSLKGDQFVEFARENPQIREHLSVQARKQALEAAMDHLAMMSKGR